MSKSFVVSEEEQAIFLDRPAEASAELISPERCRLAFNIRQRAKVKNGSRVERAITQEFKSRAVELICPGLRHRRDLRTGAFAVFGGVSAGQDVEFADRIDTEQVTADAARCYG